MQPGGAEGAAGVWAGGCSSVRFGWGLGTSLEPLWCPCYDPFFLLVLPVYGYPPMSPHPHAHVLSQGTHGLQPAKLLRGFFQARILEWIAISSSLR